MVVKQWLMQQFNEMNGISVSAEETKVLERTQTGITGN
jgi:hypothetical protein